MIIKNGTLGHWSQLKLWRSSNQFNSYANEVKTHTILESEKQVPFAFATFLLKNT